MTDLVFSQLCEQILTFAMSQTAEALSRNIRTEQMMATLPIEPGQILLGLPRPPI